jgi:ABC-type antimicrobial peptide transport system ATPase subunit
MVRITAITSKVDTSPKDVAIIMTASTLALLCMDLKYIYRKLSKPDVRPKTTTTVRTTNIITNIANWIDLISIIQVGQRVDICNKWFWQIMSLYTISLFYYIGIW